MSFSAIRQSKWDELKATMFYLDSNDFEKCRLQKNECCASLNGFVENINPEKRIYMRQLPILVSMADKEPRFLFEEVFEIASLLLRRSSKSKELPEKLKMYPGTMWACGPKNTLLEVITLTEVKQLFEDADIDKRLVTITPDVEFSSLIDMCRIGACQNLHFTDYRGKSSVYRALAIHRIFCECVLGLNWATNTCREHLNCKEDCRKKVIDVMIKYSSKEEASSMDFIPMETVQMEIAKLKREECYFKEQREVNLQFNYLFQGLSNDKIISLDLYNTMTDYFPIPKNEALSELNCAPVQGMRLSFLLGWIVQFIGVIDKDIESQGVSLANVLVSNLEFLIEKDVEKTIEFMRNEMVFDRKGLTVRAFMSDETQDKTQSKYDRMAEKAKLRKQAVQQKKNKKGGKQKLEKEKAENDYSETELKDLFNETMTLLASKSGSETVCLKISFE
ncbi:hypothetical protein B9Z55_029120 [Caenorhabditis nigoni]|nr:hypothetical protein B9Z55_029120 [Caenorhabditis nigoni]